MHPRGLSFYSPARRPRETPGTQARGALARRPTAPAIRKQIVTKMRKKNVRKKKI